MPCDPRHPVPRRHRRTRREGRQTSRTCATWATRSTSRAHVLRAGRRRDHLPRRHRHGGCPRHHVRHGAPRRPSRCSSRSRSAAECAAPRTWRGCSASGADKVGVNSAAIARPELLGEIADRFGAQVLVLSLDVKRSSATPSGFVVTTHGGRTETDRDALAWAREAHRAGRGRAAGQLDRRRRHQAGLRPGADRR